MSANEGGNDESVSDGIHGSGVDESAQEGDRPIGKGVFGNIYDQFKGKVKEAFHFLMNKKSGDLLGVFHREDIGDIDLVWGDENMGLAHILGKHVGKGKDFETADDAVDMINEVIKKGRIFQDTENRYTLMLDGIGVGIRKDFDGEKKNWVVTAIDFNRTQEGKGIATNSTSTSHDAKEPEFAAAPNDSNGKDSDNSSNSQENVDTLTFEDGTAVPMREDGNPDFSQMTLEQTAELYDTQFGEDAWQLVDDAVTTAKKALDESEEEVVADTIGDMINDLGLAKGIAFRLSHPVLAHIQSVLTRILGKLGLTSPLYGKFRDVRDTIAQAYVDTMPKEEVEAEEEAQNNGNSFSLRLQSAIDETETEPSDAQKESGNYKKGHVKFGGYDFTIENPKGSYRKGKDADGKEWKLVYDGSILTELRGHRSPAIEVDDFYKV